jgi:protocatechuate 3,4-dioxygenase beta subunit
MGPVGELLRATNRQPWQPGHYHFIVMAPGHRTLVTELFASDDPYIDGDAVLGVRAELTAPFERHDDLAGLPGGLRAADRIAAPWYSVNFDFVLPKGEGGSAAPAGLNP